MALATSYLEKHDSDALKFAPWKLGVNDIAKTLATKTAYWKQGAARVQNRYQKALGLNLVTEENKGLLKNYVTESEDAIKQLSGQDLSNPDIQEMGIKIFKNLFEDEDIVGEDFVVGSLQKEQQLGEGFRSKDGGKNYNPLSVQNIQAQQALLRKDNQRSSWKKLYPDLEKYTPYEDVSDEYSRLLKNLQAETNQTSSLGGGDWFLLNSKTVGVSKERIKKAIDELGSPQLKQQMRVEGRNTFYNKLLTDPQSVDSYYQQQATNLFGESLRGLGNNKAELEYELFQTPEDKKYASRRDAITKQIKEVDDTISTIKRKTLPDYLKSLSGLGSIDSLGNSLRKIDVISEQMGINNAASGLAYKSQINTIEENPAKIAQENLALSMLRYNETVRHNKASEYLAGQKMVSDAAKAKKDSGGGALYEGSTSNPQNARAGTSDDVKLGDNLYNQFSNKAVTDDALQEGFISTIVGGNTWSVIQSGVNNDKRLGEITELRDQELEEMAKFLKAFDQGHVLPKGMDGLFSGTSTNPKSIEDIVSTLKVSKVSALKDNLKHILDNPDFVRNTVRKLYEKDPIKINQFSTLYDLRKRDEANMSGIINKEVQKGLGDYARLFPSATNKFIVNEGTIQKAWEKLPSDQKMRYYIKQTPNGPRPQTGDPVLDGIGSISNRLFSSETKEITKAQYEEYRKNKDAFGLGFGLFQIPLSYDQFKGQIEDRTKKSLVQFHRTNLGKVESRGFEAKEVQAKTELVTMLTNAAILSNDQGGDAAGFIRYIGAHTEDIIGMETYTPTLGDYPQVRVKMKVPAITENDKSGQIATQINNYMFDVASDVIPQRLREKSNSTRNLTMRNAQILRSEVPGGGTFEIINDGVGAELEPVPIFRDEMGNIVPYLTLLDPTTNEPVLVTHEDILQKLGLTSKEQLITENTQLQARLSSLMNSWKANSR